MSALQLTLPAGASAYLHRGNIRVSPHRASFTRAPLPRRGSIRTHVAYDDTAVTNEATLTGEWPATWSLASYDSLGEWFANKFFKEPAHKSLSEVMAKAVITPSPEMPVSELEKLFLDISGAPVVGADGTLVGVVSKSDLAKGGSCVADIMSSPPVATKATATVQDAAVLMLKHKVHRIPIVDSRARCIGIVARTDIFTALMLEAAHGL